MAVTRFSSAPRHPVIPSPVHRPTYREGTKVSPLPLFADSFWADPLNTRPLIALVLVSLCCGAVGSLVVGSRMAFFSDALAHCAFAGVSVGFVLFDLLLVRLGLAGKDEFWNWVTPIMLAF